MARHKQSYSEERHTAPILVHATPSERRKLQAAADRDGVSLSNFGHGLMLRRSAARSLTVAGTRRNPDAAALWEQVRLLGVNMNQVAQKLNTFDRLDDVPELRELCREIKAVFARIMAL